MIGGRLKAKTLAAATWLKAALSSSSARKTDSFGSLRSANGFRATTTKARFGKARPSSRL